MSYFCVGRRFVSSVANYAGKKNFSTASWKCQQTVKNEVIKTSYINGNLSEDVNRLFQSYVAEQPKNKEVLLAPYFYTRSISPVTALPTVLEGFNYWLQISEDKYEAIEEVAYYLYEFITILDDLIDDANLRRSYPTPLRIYGSERTWIGLIATGLVAIEKIQLLGKPESVSGICQGLMRIMAGIPRYENIKSYSGYPSLEEYCLVAMGKTGGCYGTIIPMMQPHSDCKLDFSMLTGLLGLFAQVENDNAILFEGKLEDGKTFAEDIETASFNLPFCMAARKNNLEADIVFNIVRSKTKDPHIKSYCVQLLHKLGATQEAREFESLLFEELMKEIDRLGGNPVMAKSLEKIHLRANGATLNIDSTQ